MESILSAVSIYFFLNIYQFIHYFIACLEVEKQMMFNHNISSLDIETLSITDPLLSTTNTPTTTTAPTNNTPIHTTNPANNSTLDIISNNDH